MTKIVKKVEFTSNAGFCSTDGTSVWLVAIQKDDDGHYNRFDWMKIRGGDPDFSSIVSFLVNDKDAMEALEFSRRIQRDWRVHEHVGQSGATSWSLHVLTRREKYGAFAPYNPGEYQGRLYISMYGKVPSSQYDDGITLKDASAWDALLTYLDVNPDAFPADGYRELPLVEYPADSIVHTGEHRSARR